jgi:hypothetical protein
MLIDHHALCVTDGEDCITLYSLNSLPIIVIFHFLMPRTTSHLTNALKVFEKSETYSPTHTLITLTSLLPASIHRNSRW